MKMDTAIISVIQMDENGDRSVKLADSFGVMPTSGRYILAFESEKTESVLGWPLFPVGLNQHLDDNTSPSLGMAPKTWNPGDQLHLRGPLGRGFQIPANTRRLALVAIGKSAARLLPLIASALTAEIDVAIFSSVRLPLLPPAVEIQPLSALPDSLNWADFLAVDIPLKKLSELRDIFNLDPHAGLPCLAQVLITTPMPCGGIADCGACSVPRRRSGFKMACKDGPVFDLTELEW